MELPFENESFDAYTIAFGIRNVVRIEEVNFVRTRDLLPLFQKWRRKLQFKFRYLKYLVAGFKTINYLEHCYC